MEMNVRLERAVKNMSVGLDSLPSTFFIRNVVRVDLLPKGTENIQALWAWPLPSRPRKERKSS